MTGDRNKLNDKEFLMQMLEVDKQIQQAISGISNQESIFEDVCQEIQSSFGFDFASIALVNPKRNIIETVYETGSAAYSLIKFKYHLQTNPDLRHIRADIVYTHRTEIISGWDRRFDKWLYEEYKHDSFTPIFTPVILYRDKNGNIVEDWFEQCEWKVVTEEATDDGHRTVLAIKENQKTEGSFQVIGVISTGYSNRLKAITVEQAIASAKLVAQQSLKIRRIQLYYVLETIAEIARSNLQAEITAVDFMHRPELKDYIYQVFAGNIPQDSRNDFFSNKQVLREEALSEKKPKFILNPEQKDDNNLRKPLRKFFVKEKKAVAALPLPVKDEKGVLYLEFTNKHTFTEYEINVLNLFVNRAASAIQRAIIQTDNHVRQTDMTNLHLFTQSLIHETEKKVLLQRIVWEIANILGADVVVFNEYDHDENKFLTPLKLAGRFINQESNYVELNENDKSLTVIKDGVNIYASSLDNIEIFKDSEFVQQENLKSVAAILLKVGEEVVGVIFIYYRRIHTFSKDDKKLIETLASSAAYAIKNQRWLNSWLQTLSDIDRKLITTLEQEKLLNLIVQRAVEKTKADFGSIALLQLNSWELETKALYPKNSNKEEIGMRKSMEKGITGRVARNRRAELVNDVRQDPNYRELFPTVRSELCVPLLDKEDNLIGTLNVESSKADAFDPRDLRLLQEVANLAVITIQNAKNLEKLAKTEVMATIADIASSLVHRMNNNVGAIKVFAEDICQKGDEHIISLGTEILSLAKRLLQEAEGMKNWIEEKIQTIKLQDIVQEALTGVQIPDNIELFVDLPNNLPQVSGGKQQLINVFDNLIQNAVDIMPDGGRLSIEGILLQTGAGNWVKITVSDTGSGISEEDLEKIFEYGYTSKKSKRGMGFGLWWTQLYIKRLEGALEVKSKLGQGSQFILILPTYE